MAKGNIKGITIKIDGETTGLDRALSSAKAKSRAFSGEIKGLNSLLKMDPKNMELFRMKQEALMKSTAELRGRLKTLKDSQAQLDSQFKRGEITEEQYKRAKDELTKETVVATHALKKEEAELRAVNFQMSRMGQISAKLKAVGTKLTAIGNALKPLSIAATGATVALGGLAYKAGVYADDMNTLSKQTGIATRDLQLFAGASDLVDVSVSDLAKGHAKLTKSMYAAREGTKAQEDAFKSLGIKVVDSNGKLRDNKVVFNESIDALSKMKNATERDALAFQIFGKSAQQLNPLILGGSAELKAFTKEAEKMGIVLDQKTLNKANAFNDVLDRTKALLKMTGMAIGADFAGILMAKFEMASRKVLTVAKAFKDLSPQTKKIIISITAGLAGLAPSLLIFGKLATGLGNLIQPLMNAIRWIKAFGMAIGLSPIGLLITGLTVAGVALAGLGMKFGLTEKKVSSFVTGAVDKITKMVDRILPHLPKFIQTGAKLLTGLIQGLIKNLPKLITTAVKLITGLVQGLSKAIPQLIKVAPKLIKELTKGLILSIPILIKAAPKIIKGLAKGILSVLGAIVSAGGQIIKALWKGIVNRIAGFFSNVINFSKSIPKKIKSGIGSLFGIGLNIVKGLWQGIKAGAGWLKNAISNFASGIKNKFKQVFDIHSPSRWMEKHIGLNIAQGLGSGIYKGTPGALKSIVALFKKLDIEVDKKFKGTLKKINASSKKMLDDLKSSYKETIKDIKGKMKELVDSYVGSNGLFNHKEITEGVGEEAKTVEVLNADVIIENMRNSKKKMETFLNSFKKLKKKALPKGLLNEILSEGLDGASNVELVAKMNDKQIKKLIRAYIDKKKMAKEVGDMIYKNDLINATQKASKSISKMGNKIGKTFRQALTKSTKLTETEAEIVVRNLTSKIKSKLTKEMDDIRAGLIGNVGSDIVTKSKTKKNKSSGSVIQNISITTKTGTPSEHAKEMKKAGRVMLKALGV